MKNRIKNIQAVAYNGASTLCTFKVNKIEFQPHVDHCAFGTPKQPNGGSPANDGISSEERRLTENLNEREV